MDSVNNNNSSSSNFRRRNDPQFQEHGQLQEHKVQSHTDIQDIHRSGYHDGYAAVERASAAEGSHHSNDNNNYRNSMDDEFRERIEEARRNRDILFQDHSPRMAKLGIFSTGCLLVNRMIGTGIFETPGTVWMSTRTSGGAIFMWVLGGLITYSGLAVYLELGLTVPRYLVHGRWRSVPRSGGEKNYVGYPSLFKSIFIGARD